MTADQVTANLKGMDDLDFTGWNNADWNGVFAHHHTDDVLGDWPGSREKPGEADQRPAQPTRRSVVTAV